MDHDRLFKELNAPNPVASAWMTKMKIAAEDRPRVKLECLRMLATLKLDYSRAGLVGNFMKSYLSLTAAEKVVYNREAEAIDPEQRDIDMQYTNEWQDQGLLHCRLEVIGRQLRRRFGDLPAELPEAFQHVTIDQLDNFAEALLDFKSLADAEAWIAKSHVS